MAEQAEERAVLLGTVQERQSVDNSSPFACKAGGSPVRCLCVLILAVGLSMNKPGAHFVQ